MRLEAEALDLFAEVVDALRVDLVLDSLAVLDEEVLRFLVAAPGNQLRHRINARLERILLELLPVLLRLRALNEHLLFVLAAHASGIQLLAVVQIILLSALRVDHLRPYLSIERQLLCRVHHLLALHRLRPRNAFALDDAIVIQLTDVVVLHLVVLGEAHFFARQRSRAHVLDRWLSGQMRRFLSALLSEGLLVQSIVHIAVVSGRRRHARPFLITALYLALFFDDSFRVGVDDRSKCLLFGLSMLKIAHCVLPAGFILVPVQVSL